MSGVTLKDIAKRFGEFTAVHRMSLDIPDGGFVTLLGPSGCGKTTTLRMVAGLLDPSEGEIAIGGRRVNDLPIHKRNLGIVFQNYALFPHKTVAENVGFGLRYRDVSKDEAARRVKDALELVQLPQRGRPLSQGAFGRPAAAHRAGPRHRDRARRAPARRAALGARRQPARGHAGGAQAHPGPDRRHHDLRHPRPVRGAGHVRPHRRHVRRPGRAGRPAVGGLQHARERVRRALSRRLEHPGRRRDGARAAAW